jgi:hypothetical protein
MFENTGAHAIQIAAAAQEAVKRFSHFNLGSADINRIVAQTSYGSLSIGERVNMAQNLAQDAAKTWLDSQAKRNIVDDPQHKPNAGAYAVGGTFGGFTGLGRWDARGDARSGNGPSGSGPNSGTYSREFGPAALHNSFNALLTEGYSKAQLNAVMPHARELGWHDRQGLRDLADAGKPFAGDAAAYHRALKHGDTTEAERLKKKMQDDYEKAEPGSKPHRGMGNTLRRLHVEKKAELKAGDAPGQPTVQHGTEHANAVAAEKKKNEVAQASEWDDLQGSSAKPVVAASASPKPEQANQSYADKLAMAHPVKPTKPSAHTTAAANTRASAPSVV